LGVTVARHPF